MLIAHRADVNAKESARQQTALMWAAAGSHADVVEKLLRAGADIHARTSVRRRVVNTETGGFGKQQLRDVDMGGFTPLLFAARSGSVESARSILEASGDPNEKAADGTSALVVAAHSGHADMGIFLLSKGADPNASEAGYTALHAAILRNKPELVSALLAKGANVNAPLLKGTPARRASADWVLEWTLAGASPLWLAAKYGEPDIMRMLAQAGGDPKFVREDGTTIVMAALQKVRRQEPGVTPDVTVEEANALETVKTALALGGDVNGTDKEGNSAVHLAVTKRYASVIEILAANNADLNKKNKKNLTPLRIALDAEKGAKKPGGEQAAARTESSLSALLTKLGAVVADSPEPAAAKPVE
jgi:ankyrin repeat protein